MQQKQTRENLRAAELIVKYLKGTISTTELTELEQWVGATEGSAEFMREVTNAEKLQEDIAVFDRSNTEEKWSQLLEKVIAREQKSHNRISTAAWMNAAAVLVVAVVGWYLITRWDDKAQAPATLSQKYGSDLQPGTQKAELILSDGGRVNLSAGDDSSFTDAGNLIVKTSNGLQYQTQGESKGGWNTLRTPNGGEYRITLSDNTQVWLNAGSSLNYPVNFSGTERRVELTGEAYFEVQASRSKNDNTKMPFIVGVGGAEVRVLGTHFNVTAYDSDGSIKTTLLEGAVRVNRGATGLLIKPGEQAILPMSGVGGTIIHADVENAIAWKNGLFQFNKTPLQEVMAHLSRWYDVLVNYEKGFKLPKYFTGEIRRDIPVSKLLEMIELTGIARFKLDKNTITVLQSPK